MKYFIDTEFHEYHKQPKVCGIKIGKHIPTIDLISIGIISEDYEHTIYPTKEIGKPLENIKTIHKNRGYYAISKDFNIKDAWNSYQMMPWTVFDRNHNIREKKVYWLRENVLKPIFIELMEKERGYYLGGYFNDLFSLKNFTKIINKYGKTNKQIAEEIIEFTTKGVGQKVLLNNEIKFYAYYADYDWVVFCQLFGKMVDLPKGFPMYCIDLKQELDRKAEMISYKELNRLECPICTHEPLSYLKSQGLIDMQLRLNLLKKHEHYPKQDNEHNALGDAKWNKKLFNFIKEL